MLHKGAKIRRCVYQWNTRLTKKKESVIYFTLAVVCYYLICFKYATFDDDYRTEHGETIA